jgi:hypothetical protein
MQQVLKTVERINNMEMLLVVIGAFALVGGWLWLLSSLGSKATKVTGVVVDPTIEVVFGGWLIEQVSIGQAARIKSVTRSELERVFGRPVVVRMANSSVNVQVNGDLNLHAASVAIDIATKVAMSVK